MSDNEDDAGIEEIELSPEEVLHQMEEMWRNEEACPELTDAKPEVVDCITELVESMEDNIEKSNRQQKKDVKLVLHEIEANRLRYMLASYLRTRIRKIEKYNQHLLQTDDRRKPKLSDDERKYAETYENNLHDHFSTLALNHMPPNQRTIEAKYAEKPNLERFVFFLVNQDVDGILVEEDTDDNEEEVVDLKAGDIRLMRYSLVGHLVQTGHITLM